MKVLTEENFSYCKCCNFFFQLYNISSVPGADLREEGGGRTPFLQGFDPLPTQRFPLWFFLRNPFLVTDPKIFLKAPWAPIYTKFEGELAPKKCDFFMSKFSKKCPKTAFLTCFLKDFLRRRKFGQNSIFLVLYESFENQFGRPKENPRSAPVQFQVNFEIALLVASADKDTLE